MKISTRFQTPVAILGVWEVIFDPYNIGKTIPGCEEVEVRDDNTYLSRVTVKVAYLKARFKLISKIVEQEAPFRIVTYTTGEGVGLLSNVSQTTTLELNSLSDGSTEVAIDSELSVTGTLANLGARIMRAKVEGMAEEWSLSMKKLIEDINQPLEKISG
ncbi:carbon monoxide dehydrogenase subunit G [Paradesulfitobacterium aromaticivorans]